MMENNKSFFFYISVEVIETDLTVDAVPGVIEMCLCVYETAKAREYLYVMN